MELWERSEALGVLEGLLRDSARHGRIALLAGEAGIGKSALLAEFASRSRSTAHVLWGACDRLMTPRPLGPLHDIALQVGGALAARLRAPAPQEDSFGAFLEELSGADPRLRPVVVVEDAHWADEATLDWLTFLGRRIDRLRTLLIVSYRDDEVGPEHPLRGVLGALPSAVVRRVSLGPLSPARVSSEALRRGLAAQTVYQLTGGNPLLVTELLNAEDQSVPGAVQDVILDRIRSLPPPARDLAHLVAVVPTRTDPPLISHSHELDLCLGAGVLVAAGRGVSYRHELFRSAVEASLSPVRRAELHRRVLSVLAREPNADAARLVHHASLAHDPEAVLLYGPVAGAEAARQGAHREAARHYRAAATFADRLSGEERAELLEHYSEEAHLTGANEEAWTAREQALALREALGQMERVGENLRWVAQLAWWTGRVRQMQEAADRAVQVLERLPPSRELVMTYVAQAQLQFAMNQRSESAAWAERGRVLAQQLGEVEIETHASITRETAKLATGDLSAWTALEELHRSAHDAGLVDPAARALGSLATIVADELARYADAEVLLDRSLAYSSQHNFDIFYSSVLGARAKLRLERGDWGGALADADDTQALAGATGLNAVTPQVARGRILAARGSPEAVPALEQAARAAEGVGDVSMAVLVADAWSEYYLWCGDIPRAQEEARRGLALLGESDEVPFLVGKLAWRLWRAGGLDQPPAATAEPFCMMIDGDWQAAAAEWAARGATYLRIEALAAGDEIAAREALHLLDDLGASRAASHHRAQLRGRGFTSLPRGPRPASTANMAGLTPRQVDVLALIEEGLSNSAIAARLSVSPKTVDHHVSAVLTKLGVGSRGQAAAAARRLRAASAR